MTAVAPAMSDITGGDPRGPHRRLAAPPDTRQGREAANWPSLGLPSPAEPPDDFAVALAGLRMALMRSTTAASTWMKHWLRSRYIGHRAALLGNVEAMAS